MIITSLVLASRIKLASSVSDPNAKSQRLSPRPVRHLQTFNCHHGHCWFRAGEQRRVGSAGLFQIRPTEDDDELSGVNAASGD